MLKVFILEPIPQVPLVAFLAERPQEGNKLFQTIPPEAYTGLFERVSDVHVADVVIAPHEYVHLCRHPDYLAQAQERARAAHKPLLISAYQDDPQPIMLPGTIILRPSAYKSTIGSHEVFVPAYVEDVGALWGSEPLAKGTTPVVSFAGKAGFSGLKEQAQYLVRNYLLRHGPERQGVYFRRRALAALRADPRITLNAIVRKRYSAHRHTVEVPPEQAREEYIRSIQGAHFTLAPRGDGNYSLRFYETLALGRIPVVLDTDMPLPLENTIDYDAFTVRVPWQDVGRIGDYVTRFFESYTDEQFKEVQRQARAVFESQLYMPQFLKRFFAETLPKHLAT